MSIRLSSLCRALTALAFGALTLSACGDAADRQRTAAAPSTPSASSTPSAPSTSASTSQTMPDQPAGNTDTAKGSDDALKPMNKDEEAKTMPRPSQANDHSTLAPKQQ